MRVQDAADGDIAQPPVSQEPPMKKQDYINLIADLYNAVGIHNAKPDERVNHVDVENHTVGVLFDEAQAPNTLFLYVDLGAASLNIDAKLLWANAAVPTELDGLGCFCKWHDGAVSYRSHVLLDGKPFKGADLATSIVRAVAVAKNQLQLATQ
jgi:hypothetical protein